MINRKTRWTSIHDEIPNSYRLVLVLEQRNGEKIVHLGYPITREAISWDSGLQNLRHRGEQLFISYDVPSQVSEWGYDDLYRDYDVSITHWVDIPDVPEAQ